MRVAHTRQLTTILLPAGLLLLIVALNYFAAPASPRVREEAMRAEVAEKAVTITVPITLGSGSFKGTLTLELLDTSGAKTAGASMPIEFGQGEHSPSLRIRWPEFAEETDWTNRRDLLMWTRVRYRLAPLVSMDCVAREVTGIRGLGMMMDNLFTLRVLAPYEPSQDAPAYIRVFAENPFTGEPVSGVHVDAALYPEDDDDENEHPAFSVKKKGVTEADGSVAWDVALPARPKEDRESDAEYKLKLIAVLGVMRIEDEREIDFYRRTDAIITTDKPLYQPGQTLHLRALVYDPPSHRPRQSEPIRVEIKDEAYKTVFERDLTSDRFGVAFTDWPIPAVAPLGEYSIQIRSDDDERIAQASVRVSRYELPVFVTNVEPDLPYYLPGQNAKVKVTARFVYGESVKAGHVRVAREESRSWNFKEQKWDVTEEGVWEGDAGADGSYTATIPLAAEHKSLAEETRNKYDDFEYVARYTEEASGRSEERRFRLRITKEPIHVYMFATDSRQSAGFPLRFYVITSHADGSPAECDVQVSGRSEKGEPAFNSEARTDKHGVAAVEVSAAGNTGDLKVDIVARDAAGASGRLEDVMPISDRDGLRITTSRALYHRGEPLRVEIESTAARIPRLFVELLADGRVIRTETVELRDHRAVVAVGPSSDLAGLVTIVAYNSNDGDETPWDDDMFATHTVLFPVRRMLDLGARFETESVKPGESARAVFKSTAPDGRERETSLGVVVYDTAVEERERTESESGQGRNYFGQYCARFLNWYASLSDVTLGDLEELDDSKPFPLSLEVIASALLQRVGGGYAYRSYTGRVGSDASRSEFSDTLDPVQDTIKHILDKESVVTYPRNPPALFALLSRHGVPLEGMTDPWGNAYYVKSGIRGADNTLSISSAGPDEQRGTIDDFDLARHSKPFFDPDWSKQIITTVDAFKFRAGRLPKNTGEVVLALLAKRSAVLGVKDPWHSPYRLSYEPSRNAPVYNLEVFSMGPDRQPDISGCADDVTVASFRWYWFAATDTAISGALTRYHVRTGSYPANEAELIAALKAEGVNLAALRDPWDQPLKVTFTESLRYADRPHIERVAATPASAAVDKVRLEPITQRLRYIVIKASVPKSVTGEQPSSELTLGSYSYVVSEESRADAVAQGEKPATSDDKPASARRTRALATGLGGAISGVITDPNEAVISGATVTVTNLATNAVLTTRTDDRGYYEFVGLAPGTYSLRAEATGFKPTIVEHVEVRLSMTTTLNLTLEVAAMSETVTVQAGAAELQNTVSSSMVENLPLQGRSLQLLQVPPGLVTRPNIASTPRLRQDFPETLVWQPSLITDSHGNAEIKFNVADSITTWRLAVIGSTEDGLIGTAMADLRAFQPFFAEHQPPPSLTVGDEIETPIVVRNYQNRAADVNVKLAPSPWMQLLAGADQSVHAAAKGSAIALASFKAIAAGDFKQEASAIGPEDGDRVAKPITVRFDGRDTWRTYADLFQGEGSFDVSIPENAIADSSRIELNVYPDLFAHAVQGIEGIVQRPYGCLEQTTSAGYANLLVLQYMKHTGRALPTTEQKASANLAQALARIRSFANPDGGYFYFHGTQADTALTAYVLRFLTEAREFAPIDDGLIETTRQYLARAQRADGAWEVMDYYGRELSRQETARLTALVARALSASEVPRPERAQPSNPPRSIASEYAHSALTRSLDWLSRAAREYDDPYALSLYALAAHDAGRTDAARESALALAALAQSEQGAVFWDLQTNTPFYGWGRAGRLETTGLAVEALTACSSAGLSPPSTRSTEPDVLERAARRGLLFVIRNKDEYGVWYSTQATVNVLRGLLAVATHADGRRSESFKLAIAVDGSDVKIVDIPAESGSPIPLDLSAMFPQLAKRAGDHKIKLRGEPASTLGAAILARESVPWIDKDARGISEDGGLRLRVAYDRLDVKKGETVTCSVHAERIGSAGYGMMLAEVGLPPGVDVDTASLRRAGVLSFDATPDRVVFYLWPRAGGSDFSFTFRPRLRIKAATQPSVLYDYYNPDARVSVPPARFVVR